MIPILGLIIGLLIGLLAPISIPAQYSNYVAVAILASLDSVFGALASTLRKEFRIKIFLTGFFSNAILAAALAYIGDKLGIQIHLAAIFAFGNRLFMNFAFIRRELLEIMENKSKKNHLHNSIKK